MTYQDFKVGVNEHKDKLVLGACFVLVFVVGFGTGRYAGEDTNAQLQSHYTTNAPKKTVPAAVPAQTAPVKTQAQVLSAATSSPATSSCIVKGNISTGGKKIYHVSGGAFYDRVKPEQCFATAEEAEAAGFVKSSR